VIFHNLTYRGISDSLGLVSLSDISQEIQLPLHLAASDSIENQNIVEGDKLHYTCMAFTPRRKFSKEKLSLYKIQKNICGEAPEVSLDVPANLLHQLQLAY